MSSYGLWLSAAGMKVHEHRQTLLANNMANADTTGFKQDLAVVRQRAVESASSADGMRFAHPVLDGLAGGVNVRPVFHDFTQGPIEHTGRHLDVAIEGDGFFAVTDGRQTRYTRNGSFTLNPSGELVLGSGGGRWRVLEADGGPVRIDPAAGDVEVSSDGTIRQGPAVVGRLAIATHRDKQSLRKVGESLFEAPKGGMAPVEARVLAGALEGSNFNPMQGLAQMIETTRAYQLNATLLQLQDQATDRAVNTVGRLV